MFETLKKQAFKSTLVGSIIMIVIGLALVIFWAQAAFYTILGYAKFENLQPDKIKSQLVDIDLDLCFGDFGEEYEYKKNSNYRKTTDIYYIIITGDENATDWRYMGIKIPASYEDQMEQIMDNTDAGYYSEPLTLSGKIRKMSDKEYRYFRRIFESSDWTDEEIENGTLPYYIDVHTNKIFYNLLAVAVFAAGVVIIVLGIVRIIKASKGETLKDLRKTIMDAGCTEATAEADYNAAQTFMKDGKIRVGKLFTFYMQGSIPKAIPNAKMLWTYQTTTTHRTNGIKTGTSYSVMIYVEGVKNQIVLSMPNEAVTREVLRRIDATLPWVVVGYTDEIKKMFNKDRSQFLELRYNKVEHVAVDPSYENINNV